MTTSSSPDRPQISRRVLFQGAGALGLSAAASAWLRPASALAAAAPGILSAAPPPLSARHLVTNCLPSQPTGWPACSFYGGGSGGIATKPTGTGAGPTLSNLAESFLVLDTEREDGADKGIIDVLGGVKWGWQGQPVQP
jgi:hypothetical protein